MDFENDKQYSFTNLLQENDYHYDLQDIEKPNLFRDMFSYDEVPKVRFNHRIVPMYFPDDIWITDTTFRDGQQSRAAVHRGTGWYISTSCFTSSAAKRE